MEFKDLITLKVYMGIVRCITEFLIDRGIGVRFFGWCGVWWNAEVEFHADGMMLPCKIYKLLTVWKVFPMHKESRWKVIPHGGDVIVPISYRRELRSIVLVVYIGGLESILGILLVSPQGEHYVTVEHTLVGNSGMKSTKM